jgi:hypothetical protein
MKEMIPFIRRFKSLYSADCPACYKSWQRWHLFSLVVLALFLMVSLAWGDPVSGWSGTPGSLAGVAVIDETTSTPVPFTTDETSTPFPPEFMNNLQQTNGVILIGVLIVLIIIAGTFGVDRSRRTQ